jgi:hypothetical protein
MAHKTHDLAVKVGSYTNQQGEQKNRYQNVGALMQGDNGQFIMLAKWFNPAGVPDERGGESILISVFEPKERDQAPQRPAQRPAAQQRPAPRQAPSSGFDDFSDDPPFQ